MKILKGLAFRVVLIAWALTTFTIEFENLTFANVRHNHKNQVKVNKDDLDPWITVHLMGEVKDKEAEQRTIQEICRVVKSLRPKRERMNATTFMPILKEKLKDIAGVKYMHQQDMITMIAVLSSGTRVAIFPYEELRGTF